MSYEETGMPDDETVEPRASRWRTGRIDAVSAVIGVLFIAVAVLAVADRLWADIDLVLVVGGAIIAIGVAMIAGVFRRGRRGQPDGGLGG